jgi:hypothetical protein
MADLAGSLWQISVPDHWEHRPDPECYTMIPAPESALQISAATKEGAVTRQDMEEFARERLEQVAHVEDVTTGEFSGFTYCYYHGEMYRREWYVSRGSLMLFIGYTCEHRIAEPQDEVIDEVLATLRLGPHAI